MSEFKEKFKKSKDKIFKKLGVKTQEEKDQAAAAAEKKRAEKQKRLELKSTPLRRFYRKYLHNFIGVSFLTAVIIIVVTELFARHSLIDFLKYVALNPLVFLINTLIVFACICFAMLFKRKTFVFTMISLLWLALGIVNGIILGQRMTPFTTSDIAELKDGLSLASTYFSSKQIVMLIALAVLLVISIVLLFIKLPKERQKINYKRAIPTMLIILVISLGSVFAGVKGGVLDTFFPNLAYGYQDNGFNYCFLATWLDKGITKPADYSAEQITNIFDEEELNTTVPGRTEITAAEKAKAQTPNIIIVQLESFMDPSAVKGVELSEDPISNFRSLSGQYSSGRLQVPSMGAGTANTEFEVMSGMSAKFFGPGEYPYKTILQTEPCETVADDLKAYGYSTHAIHNHRGAFYGRNKVYPNLGFDTFTCLEYMSGVTKTPKNWAKDDVLTDQIFDALDSTTTQDYIFTISVQGHGKYPTEEILTDPKITVTKAPTEELKWQWEYYANQLYDMDQFVKDLVERVDSYDEDTIVIFYGDHMPALENISEDTLKDGRNIYQTDYVMYSNFDMEEDDQDLYSYQISSVMLDKIDIHNGTLVTYHQNHSDDEDYLANLEKLQYDMLYGEKYIYDGTMPFMATNMKMGVKDIKVTEVVKIGEKYYIRGQNFTEYSKINLDGEILDTVYLGPTLLGLKEEVDPAAVARMKVSQVEKDQEILSTSE